MSPVTILYTLTFITISFQLSHACVPEYSDYTWSTIRNVHYTITFRNVRWKSAASACNEVEPGLAKVANVESVSEWLFIKKVVPAGWYWFNNEKVSDMEKRIRYFYFDQHQRSRLSRRDTLDKHCLAYVHPGEAHTDKFCGAYWARALCEIRC